MLEAVDLGNGASRHLPCALLHLQGSARTPMSVPRLRKTPATTRSPLEQSNQQRGSLLNPASLKQATARGLSFDV